jgi:hypothetical protein
MPLTPDQLTTLGAHIAANANTIGGVAISELPHTPDNAVAVAEWYNLTAAPAFVVWRTFVTWDEIMLNGMDWARVDNLSVGKARIWDWMFNNGARAMNPAKPNIRAGIDAAWVGTAADLAVRAAVYGHCKRDVTNVERVFATGTGTTNAPGDLGFEGEVFDTEIKAIWSI